MQPQTRLCALFPPTEVRLGARKDRRFFACKKLFGIFAEIFIHKSSVAQNRFGAAKLYFIHPDTAVVYLAQGGENCLPIYLSLAGQPMALVYEIIVGNVYGCYFITDFADELSGILAKQMVCVEANTQSGVRRNKLCNFLGIFAEARR